MDEVQKKFHAHEQDSKGFDSHEDGWLTDTFGFHMKMIMKVEDTYFT